jgi:hypothetical protein
VIAALLPLVLAACSSTPPVSRSRCAEWTTLLAEQPESRTLRESYDECLANMAFIDELVARGALRPRSGPGHSTPEAAPQSGTRTYCRPLNDGSFRCYTR